MSDQTLLKYPVPADTTPPTLHDFTVQTSDDTPLELLAQTVAGPLVMQNIARMLKEMLRVDVLQVFFERVPDEHRLNWMMMVTSLSGLLGMANHADTPEKLEEFMVLYATIMARRTGG